MSSKDHRSHAWCPTWFSICDLFENIMSFWNSNAGESQAEFNNVHHTWVPPPQSGRLPVAGILKRPKSYQKKPRSVSSIICVLHTIPTHWFSPQSQSQNNRLVIQAYLWRTPCSWKVNTQARIWAQKLNGALHLHCTHLKFCISHYQSNASKTWCWHYPDAYNIGFHVASGWPSNKKTGSDLW